MATMADPGFLDFEKESGLGSLELSTNRGRDPGMRSLW